MKYIFIGYQSAKSSNTVARIGVNKILYPNNVNWEKPIYFIEVEDVGNWEQYINSFIEVKHTLHMDYLFIKTKDDKLLVLKSVHWGQPRNKNVTYISTLKK